jgi:hypothetical protein
MQTPAAAKLAGLTLELGSCFQFFLSFDISVVAVFGSSIFLDFEPSFQLHYR